MAARVDAPAVWQRGFHPLDQEMNLDAITAMIEVLLPDYPAISEDVDATKATTVDAEFSISVTAAVARGTLTYQWQKKTTGSYSNISGATSATYTEATWATGDVGTYRCVLTNTLNGVTAVTYSGECVATTAA